MLRIVVVVTLVSGWGVAQAEESSESAATAGRAYERGIRAFEAQEYERAAQQFARAYRLAPEPVVLFNIAMSNDLAQRLDRAAEHYRAFLAQVEGSGDQERLRVARERHGQLRNQYGWLELVTTPPGALIEVDGEPRGLTPFTVALPPGPHQLRLRQEGQQAAREVTLRAGETALLRIALAEASGPEPTGPEPESATPPGQSELAGTEAPVQTEPAPRPGRRWFVEQRVHHGWFWATAALATAAVGAVVITSVLYELRRQDYVQRHERLLQDVTIQGDENFYNETKALRQEGVALALTTAALALVATGLLTTALLLSRYTALGSRRRPAGRSRARRVAWAEPGRLIF